MEKITPDISTPKISPRDRIMFRTPPATPSFSLGADPMMALLLGGVNNPIPTPRSINTATSMGSCADTHINMRAKHDRAETSIPEVVIILGPYLSEIWPENGATTAIARRMGVSRAPVSATL